MPTGKQIAAKLREARFDTDLGLVYGIWPEENRNHDVMRPSEHLAIRKAASALDRIGEALAGHLTQDNSTVFRALPEILPSTRVRKTPERFWLEFDLDERHGGAAAGAVLFIEFSRSEVRIGIRFPIAADNGDRNAKSLHHHNSMGAADAADWQVEQRRPPAEPAACSIDLNTWLTGRVAAQRHRTVFQTLSKPCKTIQPPMKDLMAGLSEASSLYDNVMIRHDDQATLVITGSESQHSVLI